jgi:hypothetical protein
MAGTRYESHEQGFQEDRVGRSVGWQSIPDAIEEVRKVLGGSKSISRYIHDSL